MNGEWLNWLNRLGIVLNFAAGLLIAPELIGRDNISSAEERIEGFGQSLLVGVGNKFKGQPNPVRNLAFIILAGVLAPSLVWWRMSLEHGVTAGWWVATVVLLLVGESLVSNLLIRSMAPGKVSCLVWVMEDVVLLLAAVLVTGALLWSIGVAWTLIVGSIVIVGAVFFLSWGELGTANLIGAVVFSLMFWLPYVGAAGAFGFAFVVASICRGALRLLGPEQHRLERHLVNVGLALFIVGTAMQFFATF